MGFLSLLPGCSLDESGLIYLEGIAIDGGRSVVVAVADAMPDTNDAGADAADAADDLPADEPSTDDLSAKAAAGDGPLDGGELDTMAIGPCGTESPPLVTTGWTATASSETRNERPPKAFDGLLTTRWSTGSEAAIGDWFCLDLHDTRTISRFSMDAGPFTGDFPRGYEVSLSADDITYRQVSSGAGTDQQTTVFFPAESARYLKITLTASSVGKWWSIAELIVCGD